MFLHFGKEYYPLEVSEICGKENKKIYNRNKRNKAYVYIAVENKKKKGAE